MPGPLWLIGGMFRQARTGVHISELGGNSSTSKINIGVRWKVEIIVNYRTLAGSIRGGLESFPLGGNVLGPGFRARCTDGETEVGVDRAWARPPGFSLHSGAQKDKGQAAADPRFLGQPLGPSMGAAKEAVGNQELQLRTRLPAWQLQDLCALFPQSW